MKNCVTLFTVAVAGLFVLFLISSGMEQLSEVLVPLGVEVDNPFVGLIENLVMVGLILLIGIPLGWVIYRSVNPKRTK